MLSSKSGSETWKARNTAYKLNKHDKKTSLPFLLLRWNTNWRYERVILGWKNSQNRGLSKYNFDQSLERCKARLVATGNISKYVLTSMTLLLLLFTQPLFLLFYPKLLPITGLFINLILRMFFFIVFLLKSLHVSTS